MMNRAFDLKLIDLLSLKPGSVLQIHAVKGEAGCDQAEAIAAVDGWRDRVSHTIFPNGDPIKIDNMTKLLEIPIETQIILRREDGKVLEIMNMDPYAWQALSKRAGEKADIMVNGRIIARGEVVRQEEQYAILITHLMGSC